MKHLLLFLLAAIGLVSCGTDGCVSCEKQLPNSTSSAEICASGSDVTVRETIIGVISDKTIKNTTVADYQAVLQGQGFTCK